MIVLETSLEGRIGRHSDPSGPDSIMQSELPQVPLDEWDEPITEILGRAEGKIRNIGSVEVKNGSGEEVIFKRPVQTQFVRVKLEDGSERMEKYDPKRHGEWDAIPDTGLTPKELLEQLTGFGEDQIDQGQQFQNERKKKGGASRGHWPVRHHPKPRQR